jgi:hypothetical protein
MIKQQQVAKSRDIFILIPTDSSLLGAEQKWRVNSLLVHRYTVHIILPIASAGTTAEMEVPCSPGLRRRRSRVPSEEDDKLINYLVAGGHDGSRERNLSIAHIG